MILMINKRIEARELYRATNQAMDNYHHRRRIINGSIEELLQKAVARLSEMHSELMKVK
jgi:DnaJ-domain-containing protein 1